MTLFSFIVFVTVKYVIRQIDVNENKITFKIKIELICIFILLVLFLLLAIHAGEYKLNPKSVSKFDITITDISNITSPKDSTFNTRLK
ncbi:conserved protein of unknown function [Xenorhabdus poinarii G6]|uniref:Uncharacterized protein n=1 Tax=Xenorhabdus poinarii G6 TaxID=1354304 RepID=A0A068R8M8_9GAMM|nr:conserved protein of unknown function [Xenorhabdus poinarii G6]